MNKYIRFFFTFSFVIWSSIYTLDAAVDVTLKGVDYIKICKWKNDARVCVVFSFDDNCSYHKKISEIFDRYSFKSTFFVNSVGMFVDSLKVMIENGHEVGNHTFSHLKLQELNAEKIDFEIGKGKDMIEDALKIKCLSFAEPFNQQSSLISKIVYKHHLFVRNYSEYINNIHIRYDLVSQSKLSEFLASLEYSKDSGAILAIAGHSINGNGWNPVSSGFLIKVLDIVKRCVDKGDAWVTTVQQSGQYENLYREIVLDRTQHGDTVTLKFKNYDKVKYKDMKSSPISVEIPYYLSNELRCVTDSVDVKELKSKFVATIDLKRDTTLVLVLKGINESSNTLNKINQRSLFFYPNPVFDVLNLRCVGEILRIDIFDMSGNRQIALTSNVSTVDVSQLSKGSYLIYVKSKNLNSIIEYKAKFFKI